MRLLLDFGSMDADLYLTVRNVMTAGNHSSTRSSGVLERKFFKISKKFRSKTNPFREKAFLTTKRLGRRNMWKGQEGKQGWYERWK